MSWLYLTEEEICLALKGDNYRMTKKKKTLCEVPADTVEGAVLTAPSQVDYSIIEDSLHRGIPLLRISPQGRFLGHLGSEANQDIFKQKEQFTLLKQSGLCTALAKRILFNMAYNEMAVLHRYSRKSDDPSIDTAVSNMRASLDRLPQAETMEEVTGYKKIISRIYFYALGSMMPDRFRFREKTRHPAKDPVSSLLEFGYSLLLCDFYTAIEKLGLYPYVGIFHPLKNGCPSLASDLMAPWKPVVIDSISFSLLNEGILKESAFDCTDPEGAVWIKPAGRRILAQQYERKMSSVNPYFQGQYSWRETIMIYCESFLQVLSEKNVSLLKTMIIR